jgi:hypothetical protein
MDYQKGKIYRLVCAISDKQYVGSTTQPLHKRLWNHKHHYKRWKDGKRFYYTAFELYETGERVSAILLEDSPCQRKEQLLARERYWIENIEGGCVNKHLPTRTFKEWFEQHKEEQSVKGRAYRKEHRERRREYDRAYGEQHKEEKAARDRAYRETHRDKVLERQRAYREKNRDNINQKRRQKILCSCGVEHSIYNKNHVLSKSHKEWLAYQQ